MKKHKGIFGIGYIVFISVIALQSPTILRDTIGGLGTAGHLVLSKMIPWTLCPMLSCALLGAYYVERGYSKAVGIIGTLLMLASAIVVSASLYWMWTAEESGDMVRVMLNGYKVSLPVAMTAISSSFMRGGAIGVLMYVLTTIRNNMPNNGTVSLLMAFAVSSIGITSFLIGMFIPCLQAVLGWSLVFCVMLIPVLILCTHMPHIDNNARSVVTQRRSLIISAVIVVLCFMINLFFWKYIPYYCRKADHFIDHGLFGILCSSLFFAFVGFVIYGFIIKNKTGARELTISGSIMMMLGFPLTAAVLNMAPIWWLLPTMLMGIGSSCVIAPNLYLVVTLPVHWFSLLWVGIAATIIIANKLLLIFINHITAWIGFSGFGLYVAIPLLTIVIVGFCFLSSQTESAPDTTIMN